MLLSPLITVAVAAAVAAAGTMLVATYLRARPRASWAISAALGYIAGHLAAQSHGGLATALLSVIKPHEARDWLPLAVLLAAGVTIFAAYAPRRWRPFVVGLAALLTLGVPLRLLAGSVYVEQNWSTIEKLAYLVLLAAVFGLVWLALATASHREPTRVLRPTLLAIFATGTALVLALSGSLGYGKLTVATAAAIAGTAITSHAAPLRAPNRRDPTGRRPPVSQHSQRPRSDDLSGVAGVITFSLGSLLLLGHFYAELTATNAALLVLSLIAAAGRLPAVVSKAPPWQQAALRATLCLVPLAVAIVSATAAVNGHGAANPYIG